jgi:hypothetical protein
MANKDPLLTLEEFTGKGPRGNPGRRNNFHLHFQGEPGKHWMGDIYRKNVPYRECMRARGKEFANLARWLQQQDDKYSPEYIEKLYEAYKLMHPFAESNWQMFQ